MMKTYIIIIPIIFFLKVFAASPEQVEQYISVSGTEERLIRMESQLSEKDRNVTNGKDKQLLSIYFKKYLEKHLSENEMDNILNNYKNVLLLQFTSIGSLDTDFNKSTSTVSGYVQNFKKTPESKVRIDIIDKLNKNFYSKKSILILFDELMKPNLMKNGISAGLLKTIEKDYLKTAIESLQSQTLYKCREFTNDELEELLKISKSPSVDHETKAVYGAMAYALKKFIKINHHSFSRESAGQKIVSD